MNGMECIQSSFPVSPIMKHAAKNIDMARTLDVGDKMKRTILEADACLNDSRTAALHSIANMRFNGKAKNDIIKSNQCMQKY